jgi:hypothetical protein
MSNEKYLSSSAVQVFNACHSVGQMAVIDILILFDLQFVEIPVPRIAVERPGFVPKPGSWKPVLAWVANATFEHRS